MHTLRDILSVHFRNFICGVGLHPDSVGNTLYKCCLYVISDSKKTIPITVAFPWYLLANSRIYPTNCQAGSGKHVDIYELFNQVMALMVTSKKSFLAFVLLFFFALGALYSYYTPLWTPADEERHYAYMQFVARNHTLPRFTADFEETEVFMAFHPPLYYLLGSLFVPRNSTPVEEEIIVNPLPGPTTLLHPREQIKTFSGNARTAYAIRLLSLMLGSLTVVFVYKTALIVFSGRHDIAALAALLVAMNPQFMHVCASVSNETLSTTIATAYIFFMLRCLREPTTTGQAALLGVLLGCALLTKTSCFFLGPLTLCVFISLGIRGSKNAVGHALLIVLLSAAIGGWWYLRNWLVYDDPFFAKTMTAAHPWAVRVASLSPRDILTILQKSFISYFGYFGGQKVALGWPHLVCYGAIMLCGAAGCVRSLFKPGLQKHDLPLLFVLVFALLGGMSIFALFNLKYVGAYQGRYLFVVISPITILACIGLHTIGAMLRPRLFYPLIAAGLITLNVWALFFVLRTGYAPPRIEAALQQELFDYPSPAITAQSSVGQSFIAPCDNLCGIEVLFATRVKRLSETLFFTLCDQQSGGRVLHTIRFPARNIWDFTRYYFAFPPLHNSAGNRYSFHVMPEPGTSKPGAIALWHNRQDVYAVGTMLVNGEPAGGDVYFTVYCFTGDTPTSVLEGSRPYAYYQGLYLDIWELQLHMQRSKELRPRTHTHEKFQRLQAAHGNREG
jgi:hypothetical protein